MKSLLAPDFFDGYSRLPSNVRDQARRSYRLWRADPYHSSLQFKRIHASEPIFSARVGIGWRVVGSLRGDTVTWFWIGSHAEYDSLLARF